MGGWVGFTKGDGVGGFQASWGSVCCGFLAGGSVGFEKEEGVGGFHASWGFVCCGF